MRDAHETHESARACRTNCLMHGFLRTHAFQNSICAYAPGEFLHAGHVLVTTLRQDVSRAELQGQLLTFFMTAHRNDSFRAFLFCRENSEQSHRAVTDHPDPHARLPASSPP